MTPAVSVGCNDANAGEAGFRDIVVNGDYTDKPAASGHGEIVFTAMR